MILAERMLVASVAVLLAAGIIAAQLPDTGSVTIVAHKFRNTKGSAGIAIYKSTDGFPDTPEKAVWKVVVPLEGDSATTVAQGLEAGTYAVVVLHDENNNGRMDKNIVGRPKEGYGISNNAKPRTFGPPSFQDAVFTLDKNGRHLTIDIHY